MGLSWSLTVRKIMNNTVLFVDDERPVLNSLKRLFADTDIDILVSDNARFALDILRQTKVALVVSDNCMPDMNGVDFLSMASNISPDTVRMILTGHADISSTIEAINRGGVYRFIEKPWNDDELMVLVEEGLQHYNIIISLKTMDEAKLLSLAQTIELKDLYTRGHCNRVAEYAVDLARLVGMDEESIRQIRFGGWLHDSGKIGVPEDILNKDGPLTGAEFDIIKKHPQWGAQVVRQAGLSEIIVNIVLHHHEGFSEQGYPDGLKGNDIPLEARIVAVADVWDALCSDRSYRKAYGRKDAQKIIVSMKGKNLDPKLVDLFLTMSDFVKKDESNDV